MASKGGSAKNYIKCGELRIYLKIFFFCMSFPETNPTDLIFSGIFEAAPSQKLFEITPYKFCVRYFCTLPQRLRIVR
jgi:hypothetical protein